MSKGMHTQINKQTTKQEIARRTSEELSDIHLDVELNEACAVDVQHYCRDVPAGQGRGIVCVLFIIMCCCSYTMSVNGIEEYEYVDYGLVSYAADGSRTIVGSCE
jgi:hypothetical protein